MNAGQVAEALVKLLQDNGVPADIAMNACMRVSALCAHQVATNAKRFGSDAEMVYRDVGKALGKRHLETVH